MSVLSRLTRTVACLPWVLAVLPAGAAEIHEAVQAEDLERVRALVKENPADLLATDDSKRTPLHWAALKDDLELLQAVFHEDALEARDFINYTPIYLAVMGQRAATEWLLDRGARLDVKTRFEGQTPLHWAAEQGHGDIVALLIERGAEVEARNLANSTPLLVAAKAGRAEAVKALLAAGAEVDASNMVKITALMLAAASGHEEVVELLLEAGADPKARNAMGQTAAELAAKRGHEAIVERLQGEG